MLATLEEIFVEKFNNTPDFSLELAVKLEISILASRKKISVAAPVWGAATSFVQEKQTPASIKNKKILFTN